MSNDQDDASNGFKPSLLWLFFSFFAFACLLSPLVSLFFMFLFSSSSLLVPFLSSFLRFHQLATTKRTKRTSAAESVLISALPPNCFSPLETFDWDSWASPSLRQRTWTPGPGGSHRHRGIRSWKLFNGPRCPSSRRSGLFMRRFANAFRMHSTWRIPGQMHQGDLLRAAF